MTTKIDWDAMKFEDTRRPGTWKRCQQLLNLRHDGYTVVEMAPFYYRVNDRIDVWAAHSGWHDLKTNERGGSSDLASTIKHRIRPKETGHL